MAEVPYPPVDYTSRDYRSLREDMLAGIPSRIPEWTSRNQNDYGITLIELFAYMGDGLHYYADRIANEAMLLTATQRRSVLNHARLLDYRPRDNVAATVELLFSNAGGSPAVIPSGTRVSTSTADPTKTPVVYYETDAEVTVPAGGSASVAATEGATVALEELGTSSGQLDQSFALFTSPVIEGSVRVVVAEGAPVEWTYYSHLLDASVGDRVFSLLTDERGVTHVLFGDGANGKVPAGGSVIRATYRVGGGVRGNVGPEQITRIVTTVPAGVTVINQAAATGGADAETLTEIKVNAPRSLLTLGRAVTIDDYANLAVQVPTAAKAQAVSGSPSSVTLYVAPTGGDGYEVDGVTPSARLQSAMDDVEAHLADKMPPGATLTVSGPDYIEIDVTMTVHVRDEFQQETVRQYLIRNVTALFAFDNVVFGGRFTPGDVYALLAGTPGVAYGEAVALDRDTSVFTDPEPSSADAVMRLNEIPKLGSLTINLVGGIPG